MAFDFLTPEAVSLAMARRGVHGRLRAALLREGVGLTLKALFANVPDIPTMPFNYCEKTGATDTTLKWNLVAEDIFVSLRPRWSELNLGLELEGRRFFHLQWADNWLLLASSPENLQLYDPGHHVGDA